MIPYCPFPTIDLGPLSLHTFGLATAAGVLIGFHLLQVHGRDNGLDPASLARLATRLVVAGLIGARAAYVAGRPDYFLGRPLEAVAVWDGGLQFFGGLVAGGGSRPRSGSRPAWRNRHPRWKRTSTSWPCPPDGPCQG